MRHREALLGASLGGISIALLGLRLTTPPFAPHRSAATAPPSQADPAVQERARLARYLPSIVLVEASPAAAGAARFTLGCFVSSDGYLVTSLSGLGSGERRRLAVVAHDATRYEQVDCVAEERDLDSAVLRIDRAPTAGLPLSTAETRSPRRHVILVGGRAAQRWDLVRGVLLDGHGLLLGARSADIVLDGGPVLSLGGEVLGLVTAAEGPHLRTRTTAQSLGRLLARVRTAPPRACGVRS